MTSFIANSRSGFEVKISMVKVTNPDSTKTLDHFKLNKNRL